MGPVIVALVVLATAAVTIAALVAELFDAIAIPFK